MPTVQPARALAFCALLLSACAEPVASVPSQGEADGGVNVVPLQPSSTPDAGTRDASTVSARDASTASVQRDAGIAQPTTPFEEPGTPRLSVAYTILVGAAGLLAPETPPPGANHWSCRSSTHPRPVVLVNGTFANQNDNWQTLAPLLWNEGYCVFTFNYGGPPLLGTIYGTHDVASSAAELAAFVDVVLARTGASEVDLVGHSQGGMMPRYYLKYLGGAAKVHQLVALAPSNRGTTLDGLITLMDLFGLRAVIGPVLTSTVCASCVDQMKSSPLIEAVNAGGDTVPGVTYTVIATKYDEIVTPYTSQFLSGPSVTNVLVQDVCALDLTGHIGIVFDPIALQLVLNALDPSRARAPTCRFVPFAS